ncbi:MAG: methyltransferase domain-containing protein [Parcubacteria group bacterium]|nr:methyltransferase domain-containing protein [Parcubacteria group bacterium]
MATPLSLRKETCVHRVRSFVWSSWVMEQWGWPSRVLGHSLSVFRWFRARPIGFFGKERTLLDIGCGAGVFLRQQAQLGWSVFGLEPSYDMVESCRKKGLDVRQGFSISQGWTEKKFDVISLNQVFEHVDNPREVLMDVYESLQLGGVLVMNLPNWRSGAAQIFRSYWYNLDTPRHNLLVTPGTLRAMVVESGFQIKGMYTLSSMKGWTGSIEYWLRDFLGIHVSEGAISGSKFLNLLLKPMVKVLDLLYLGDNLHVIAKKK